MYGIDYPNDLVDVIYKLNTDLILKSILKSKVTMRLQKDKGLRVNQERI